MEPIDTQQWLDSAQRCLDRHDYQRAHQLCVQVLQHQADHPHAHYLLALNAIARHQLAKANTLLKVARTLAPAHPDYALQSVRLSMLLHQTPAALKQLDAIVAQFSVQGLLAPSCDTAGVLYSQMNEQARALPFFQRAVSLAPNNPNYLFNLAACERFVGDFAEALTHLQKLVAIAPDYYPAYRLLAELDNGQNAEKRIAQVDVLLNQSLSTKDRLQLSHAMWRDYQSLQQAELAFSYLEAGNTQHFKTLSYSLAQDVALFEQVRTVCDAAFCQRLAPVAVNLADAVQPVFVIGMPRSGTTLVERILSSHSGLGSLGELQDWPVLVKRASASQGGQVLNADSIAKLNSQALHNAAGEYMQRIAFYTQRLPQSQQAQLMIDKLPLNFFYAAFILKALPQAKILCLRRNPMDVCFSNYKQLFASGFSYYNYSNDIESCAHYLVQFEKLMQHWQQYLPAARYKAICYEDLVHDTETLSQEMFEFLGLEWQPSCLGFAQHAAPVTTASAVQVRQGIHTQGIGAWRQFEDQFQSAKAIFANAGVDFE